ncbi:hypothetical protein JB92DRAFT_254607 [Gautieria morchelliformis]|nr:hypothetical protein JB92DRAFT_254607 [Gautieria morchelliformis]
MPRCSSICNILCYSCDPDEAEKGERVASSTTEVDHVLVKKPLVTNNTQPVSNPQKLMVPPANSHNFVDPSDPSDLTKAVNPYAKYCQPDSLIWRLYLEETEAEDQEVTYVWKNGLDSLLVFAGLFAGILTAFLIQSRMKLQEDPTQRLLSEILQTLRNGSQISNASEFQPSRTFLNVNGLWFSSLTLTLVSALAGVLAKGWLAKYTPTSRGERCNDACDRHLRYIRARQWNLFQIITAVPILIQLSLFLFFVGLVLLTLDDNTAIGFSILVLITFTLILYIVGTLLPWFSPACPFETPISDFFPAVARNGRYGEGHDTPQQRPDRSLWQRVVQFTDDVKRRPEMNRAKAEILAWIVAKSTNEDTIKEAVKAIAGMGSSAELSNAFQAYGAIPNLCQRFLGCFQLTPGLPFQVTDISQTEAYLLALLQFPVHSVSSESKGSAVPLFLSLLESGQPLHRWDNFDPCLQALAFSLRVHILVNCNKDESHQFRGQTENNLGLLATAGATLYFRRLMIEAVIQGLTLGDVYLQQVSIRVLSEQIKMATVRTFLCQLGPSGIYKTSNNALDPVSKKLVEQLKDYSDDRILRDAIISILSKLVSHSKFFLAG